MSGVGRLRFPQTLQGRVSAIQSLSDDSIRALPGFDRFLLAPALRALAGLYAAGSGTRNWLYRQGLLRPTYLPCPVVSIGTLTHQGTGKTPFVEYLARHFCVHHRLPSLILQCGRGTVDETIMMRHSLDPMPIVIKDDSTSPSEVREFLLSNPAVRLVLLDDGLQHLPLVRDIEVVMVSAVTPWGNGHLLPRGTLRERPRAALRRADSVVLHHVDLAGPAQVERVQGQLAAMSPRHTLYTQTRMAPADLRSLIPQQSSLDMSETPGPGGLLGEHVPLGALRGAAVVCLAGIGMPQTLEAHLRGLGASLVEGCGDHEDHHMFSVEELAAAVARVEALAAHAAAAAEAGAGAAAAEAAAGSAAGPAAVGVAAGLPAAAGAAAMAAVAAKAAAAGGGGASPPPIRHACIVMTEKDWARQADLFHAFFSQHQQQWQRPGPAPPAAAAAGSAAAAADAAAVADAAAEGAAAGGAGGAAPGAPPPIRWGAYVLHSQLEVVEADKRFSSQGAVLSAMLRMCVDNFRSRSYRS